MNIDNVILVCNHDRGEHRDTWKEAAFMATAEVMKPREAFDFCIGQRQLGCFPH